MPLSIVVGDVNGLKLTNDVFGHFYGDMLLKKISEVLKRCCREGDVIARWGGDEFALLLPKTRLEETEKIIAKIKEEFSKEQIRAIKGSISMGADVKQDHADNILEVLDSAEKKMYMAKTVERDEVKSSAIDAIIETLHNNSAREKEHSYRVSELCELLGRALNMPEGEIRKLRQAGYLHDIGKIVLDPKLADKTDKQGLIKIEKHTTVGYRLLNYFEGTIDLADSILAHHERWDGKGYPRGLKGEEIPLTARIIAVAESFDHMMHDSENATALSREVAIRKIWQNAGTQFDPQIAEAFISFLKAGDATG